MRCENMIASIKKDFSVLNMVTDSWIPACGVWVGDYPYLDRTAFRDFVATVEPAMPRSIKNSQKSDSSRTRKEDKSMTPQSKSKNDRVGDDIDKNKYRWDKDETTDYNFDSLKLTSSDVEYYENFPMEGRDSRNGADASYKNEVDVNFDWDIDIDEKRESAAIDAANDSNDIQMRSKMRKASVTDDNFDVFSVNGKSDGNNNNDRNMKSIKNRFPTSTPLPKGRGRGIK